MNKYQYPIWNDMTLGTEEFPRRIWATSPDEVHPIPRHQSGPGRPVWGRVFHVFFLGKDGGFQGKKRPKVGSKRGIEYDRIWMHVIEKKYIQNVNKMWRMELFNTPLGFSSGNKTRQQKISRFDRYQAWLTGDYLPSFQICGLKKNIQAIGKCPFDFPQAMTWSTTEHHQLFISKRSINGQFLHSCMWEFLKIGIPKSPLVSILSHGHPRLRW